MKFLSLLAVALSAKTACPLCKRPLNPVENWRESDSKKSFVIEILFVISNINPRKIKY